MGAVSITIIIGIVFMAAVLTLKLLKKKLDIKDTNIQDIENDVLTKALEHESLSAEQRTLLARKLSETILKK